MFLPGAMTGLILAGVHPVQAVLVQAVVMFLILGSVAATALGTVRLAFTRDHACCRSACGRTAPAADQFWFVRSSPTHR